VTTLGRGDGGRARPAGSVDGVRPILVYSAGRLAVFTGLAAVLWLIGLRGFWLLGGALLLSVPVAFLVLGRQRAALVEWVEARGARRANIRARLRGEE